MPNRNAETELEETEKVALIARQRGKRSRLVRKGLCQVGGGGEGGCSEESYSVGGARRDQLPCGHSSDCVVVR